MENNGQNINITDCRFLIKTLLGSAVLFRTTPPPPKSSGWGHQRNWGLSVSLTSVLLPASQLVSAKLLSACLLFHMPGSSFPWSLRSVAPGHCVKYQVLKDSSSAARAQAYLSGTCLAWNTCSVNVHSTEERTSHAIAHISPAQVLPYFVCLFESLRVILTFLCLKYGDLYLNMYVCI